MLVEQCMGIVEPVTESNVQTADKPSVPTTADMAEMVEKLKQIDAGKNLDLFLDKPVEPHLGSSVGPKVQLDKSPFSNN